MQWSERFTSEQEPSQQQIREFAATPLWDDLTAHVQETYKAAPKLFYSRCGMDGGAWMGWNVKYKKSGRPLCTLYPKQGYFVALIPVGEREMPEAELLMPFCDAYTKNLYTQTETGYMGKSLGVEVTSENILRDVKNLVALRAAPSKK